MAAGHIPRERFLGIVIPFWKKKEGRLDKVFSTTYQPSPIPSGDLEIPLVLWFQNQKYVTYCKMKKFVQTLYDYMYTRTKADSSDEEPEQDICCSVEESNIKRRQ